MQNCIEKYKWNATLDKKNNFNRQQANNILKKPQNILPNNLISWFHIWYLDKGSGTIIHPL